MHRLLIILFIITTITTSCSIKLPDIKITGEKTALENQILGEYRKIKEDVWLIASERSGDKFNIPVDNSKVLKAVRDRLFYQDDLKEYKVKGVLGGLRSGFITVLKSDKYVQLRQEEQDLVTELKSKENIARKTILERIVELNPNLSQFDQAEIELSFFKLMLAESPEDSYYQDEESKWVKK